MEDEADFSGSFWSNENVKETDVLTIVTKPMGEEVESPTEKVYDPVKNVMKPKKFMTYKCDCEMNGVTKTYKIDNKTGLRFQRAWGKKFSDWIGKQFKCTYEPYKAFGQDKVRVAGYPLNQ